MAELIVSVHPKPPRRVKLGAGTIVVGRDPNCDIYVDDSSTSRRHAEIRCENGRYFVEDLGSKNGTLVNNLQVTSKELSHRDEIALGEVLLTFLTPGALGSSSTVIVADDTVSSERTSYSARDAALLLSQQRLEMLYDLSERLTTLRHQDELLEDALGICFDTLRFERGAVAIRRKDGRGVTWPVVRNLRGPEGELTISRTILGRALDHGERAIINDAGSEMGDPTVSIVQHGIRSAMCVPLTNGDEILGVIYGDRVSSGTIYTQEDVDFLAALAQQVSIGLINSRLLDEQRIKQALEVELGLAREIQNGLFPQSLPEHEKVSIAVMNDPGKTVSGDYYDILELSDGKIGFVIADVTGKGAAASLLMSNLQAAVRMTLRSDEDLGELMARWNHLIVVNTDASKFITCLSGIIDPVERKLTFSCAGHHTPYLIHTDPTKATEVHADPGFPLGVADDVEYRTESVDLQDQPCIIFCYTDGVTEAMDTEDREFGEEAMIKAMVETPNPTPEGLIAGMRKAISEHCGQAPQSDDITMIAIQLR